MLVNGSDFYCGNSSGSPCQFALKSQIPSQYIHPATKQCNYSGAGTKVIYKQHLSFEQIYDYNTASTYSLTAYAYDDNNLSNIRNIMDGAGFCFVKISNVNLTYINGSSSTWRVGLSIKLAYGVREYYDPLCVVDEVLMTDSMPGGSWEKSVSAPGPFIEPFSGCKPINSEHAFSIIADAVYTSKRGINIGDGVRASCDVEIIAFDIS